jgi:hypothetical protein
MALEELCQLALAILGPCMMAVFIEGLIYVDRFKSAKFCRETYLFITTKKFRRYNNYAN